MPGNARRANNVIIKGYCTVYDTEANKQLYALLESRRNTEIMKNYFPIWLCLVWGRHTLYTYICLQHIGRDAGQQPNVPRLVLMTTAMPFVWSHQKFSMVPRARSLITQSPGCAYMTWGQGYKWKGAGPCNMALAPGAPMDLNEEVPYIHSYQVTNQIIVIGKKSTEDNRIHLVSSPLLSLCQHITRVWDK